MSDKNKHIVVAIVSCVIIALALFGSKDLKFANAQTNTLITTYNDPANSLNFNYPTDFVLQKTQIVSTGQTYLELSPKQSATLSDSAVIQIIIEKDNNPTVSISDKILSTFPDKRKSDLKRLSKSGSEGTELIERGSGGELYIYDFFRMNGNIYLVSFREKYFREGNSFLLINNLQYLNQYLLLLNSITF